MNVRLLKSKRAAKGLNQTEASGMIGLGTSRYCQKENGNFPFSLREVRAMTDVYDLTLDDVNDIFFDGALPKSNA